MARAPATSSTSVPSPGAEVTVARPPARAIRPRTDSARPCPPAGTASGSKPRPRSRTNTVSDPGSTSRKTATSSTPACTAAFVIASRAASTSDCVLLVERRIAARRYDLDAHAVQLLDLRGRILERRHEARARGEAAARVEPRAQLPLLAPRELPDAARVLGVTLDERERLQHRVVHPRRQLAALLRPDARDALGVPLAGELPRPRAEHEQQRDCDDARPDERP